MCLRLQLAIVVLLLAGTAAENCGAASPDSNAPGTASIASADAACEHATIQDICDHTINVSGQVTLEGNTRKEGATSLVKPA